MGDGRNLTGGPGPGLDPDKFAGFADFKLKKGVPPNEVHKALMERGLDERQASALVNKLNAKIAMDRNRANLTPLVYARVAAAALVGMLLALQIWDIALTGTGRQGGYVLVGVLVAAGVVLARWDKEGGAFPVIGVVFTLLGLVIGAYNTCEIMDYTVWRTAGDIFKVGLDQGMVSCAKKNIAGSYDIIWAGLALAANWFIIKKRWIG